MNSSKTTLTILGVFTAGAHAAVVSLTPGQINSLDTNTASFTNTEITLTPLIGATPSTFNGNGARLGIDGVGSNNNAFNDPDVNPTNGNEEKLQFDFNATSGLTQIAWDFSRADGSTAQDGVIITGFLSDPGASLTGAVSASSVSYDAGAGALNVQIAGANFGDPDGFLNLSAPAASAGQTLLLSVTDTDQAGSQLAITGISYENAVIPEPSSLGLLGLAAVGLLARRRR